METIGPIQLLSDGSIVFYGPDQLHNKLKRHNLHTGTEVSCVDIRCGGVLLWNLVALLLWLSASGKIPALTLGSLIIHTVQNVVKTK